MLKYLDVLNCEELEQIFDSSDAQELKSQQVLTYLEIKECFQLEKDFNFEHEADNDDQEGTEKDGEQELLENLKDIRLSSLPNFKEIHHRFKLKDHVERYIKDCPKYAPNLYLHPVFLRI
ncbi:hypothetical protein CR513_58055, partial [Mucuna pruriens]